MGSIGRDELLRGGTPSGGTFRVDAGEAVYLGHFVIDCAHPSAVEAFSADFAGMWPTLPALQYRLFETTRFGTPFTLPP